MTDQEIIEKAKNIAACVPFIDNGAGVAETQECIRGLIERIRVLGGDPRINLRYTVGLADRTMYAVDDAKTADATAGALSEATGMVTWVKDHAATDAPRGALARLDEGVRP